MRRTRAALRRAVTASAVALGSLVPAAPHATAVPVPPDRLAATDLAVSSVVPALIPRTGGTGTVTATVANGPAGATATNVVVGYALPAGIAFAPDAPGATAGCGTAPGAPGLVTCPLGTIAPGGSATVAIGVAAPAGAAGPLAGTFLAPRSDQWDPAGGELAHRSWNHEAGGQGTSLQLCWPVDRPAPDLACPDTGGMPDAPDATELQDEFPEAFSEPVTRSWEWRGRIRTTGTGTVQVCVGSIDDGGYVAISPAGVAPSGGDVVLDVLSFGTPAPATAQLAPDTDHDVLIRISNRGAAGPDNGGTGPGGWNRVRITSGGCGVGARNLLGAEAAVGARTVEGAVVRLPLATVRTTGTVTDGRGAWTHALVANFGPDEATVVATATGQIGDPTTVVLPAGGVAVVTADLRPGTAGVLGTNPWRLAPVAVEPPP